LYFKSIPWLIQKIFKKAIWSVPHSEKIYLSFDDGPNPNSTPQLLSFLRDYKIKAQFFCLGRNAELYPHLFDQIVKEGHQIGNHGYEHISGWSTDSKQYLDNIDKADKIIRSSYFRPAYGRLTFKLYNQITKKYKLVLWNCMPGDFDPSRSIEEVKKVASDKLMPGSIVVLHDHEEALEKIKAFVIAASNKGFRFDLIENGLS